MGTRKLSPGLVSARSALGRLGELEVADWYRREGCEIVETNWRCREGEIDIIVRDPGGTYVFCEVKTRTCDVFGSPFEAVNAAKRRRLRILASRWLSEHRQKAPARAGHRSCEVRFDVAGVTQVPGRRFEVEVLQGAF